VIQAGEQGIVQKRTKKDIWQHLYQFPLVEHSGPLENWDELIQHDSYPAWLQQASGQLARKIGPQKQDLSHQRIVAVFWEIQLPKLPAELPSDLISVERKNLRKFAFPKIIDWYLSNKSLYLF
jgi:A/G-specific adenine glycosylase